MPIADDMVALAIAAGHREKSINVRRPSAKVAVPVVYLAVA
jgi:hypothetical protein